MSQIQAHVIFTGERHTETGRWSAHVRFEDHNRRVDFRNEMRNAAPGLFCDAHGEVVRGVYYLESLKGDSPRGFANDVLELVESTLGGPPKLNRGRIHHNGIQFANTSRIPPLEERPTVTYVKGNRDWRIEIETSAGLEDKVRELEQALTSNNPPRMFVSGVEVRCVNDGYRMVIHTTMDLNLRMIGLHRLWLMSRGVILEHLAYAKFMFPLPITPFLLPRPLDGTRPAEKGVPQVKISAPPPKQKPPSYRELQRRADEGPEQPIEIAGVEVPYDSAFSQHQLCFSAQRGNRELTFDLRVSLETGSMSLELTGKIADVVMLTRVIAGEVYQPNDVSAARVSGRGLYTKLVASSELANNPFPDLERWAVSVFAAHTVTRWTHA